MIICEHEKTVYDPSELQATIILEDEERTAFAYYMAEKGFDSKEDSLAHLILDRLNEVMGLKDLEDRLTDKLLHGEDTDSLEDLIERLRAAI
jgi:hypothetical protein|tara:strand:+ start:60 stop:335 length:276 start_codon:yes stop_codon:yes gene_type:complete